MKRCSGGHPGNAVFLHCLAVMTLRNEVIGGDTSLHSVNLLSPSNGSRWLESRSRQENEIVDCKRTSGACNLSVSW